MSRVHIFHREEEHMNFNTLIALSNKYNYVLFLIARPELPAGQSPVRRPAILASMALQRRLH